MQSFFCFVMDPVVKPRDDRGEIDPRSLRLLAMTEWYPRNYIL
ncbi:MAG TPA: palindromic element RPE4 domain-containing protein [Rickettsia endosymbiont of Ceroptres masudai]|nr:palindromic element RPE4 domain-containing protein [Rickettsia endosymbiont of Ceroptres masudai]